MTALRQRERILAIPHPETPRFPVAHVAHHGKLALQCQGDAENRIVTMKIAIMHNELFDSLHLK
jgi:hypothetical protein